MIARVQFSDVSLTDGQTVTWSGALTTAMAQLPLARKRALADHVIDNDKDIIALRASVDAAHAGLALLYGGSPNGNPD